MYLGMYPLVLAAGITVTVALCSGLLEYFPDPVPTALFCYFNDWSFVIITEHVFFSSRFLFVPLLLLVLNLYFR